MIDEKKFNPPFGMRGALLQSILASSSLRTLRANPMLEAASELVLEVEGGVRLLGSLSKQPNDKSKGLVIMLHGWEGSVDSTYVQLTGRTLYQRGFDVFRLNFRDHGSSHHLNQGLFRSSMLEEVFLAVGQAAALQPNSDVFLCGFSLGGNFALRIARECVQRPIANLRSIAVVSPLLDPDKATTAIDEHPLFRRYFMKKWKHSLIKKQTLFPDLYDFGRILSLDTIRAMTDALVDHLAEGATTKEYFLSYTLLGDALAEVKAPVTMFAAQDDPVIPFDDFRTLKLSPSMELIAPRHGGHSGFVMGPSLRSWYQEHIADLFESARTANS